MAVNYHAAIIRENLTVMAREKEAPDYQGRAFNKMINNGSKGQYIGSLISPALASVGSVGTAPLWDGLNP